MSLSFGVQTQNSNGFLFCLGATSLFPSPFIAPSLKTTCGFPHHCRFPIRAVLCAAEGCASTKSRFHLRFWQWHRPGGRISSSSKAKTVFGPDGLFLHGLLALAQISPKYTYFVMATPPLPTSRKKGFNEALLIAGCTLVGGLVDQP